MAIDCDVAIIGAGHKGLVCAAYLAKAGMKVKVFERRSIVGGAAVTEEFYPGFRNSICSYTVSLLNKKVVDDLNLYAHGLQLIERPLSNFLPLEGGGYLKAHANPQKMKAEVARHCKQDAEQLVDYASLTFLSPLFLKLRPTLEVGYLTCGDFGNLGDGFKP